MKPYDVGLICGRFQMMHKGHEKLIDTGLLLCDKLLIFVGSSQLSGTERNPFSVETRIRMLKEVYGDNPNVMIYGLADLSKEDGISPVWGKYLLENARKYLHKDPDIMIYGNDESRSSWFQREDLKNTSELIINRAQLTVSATMTRQFMAEDNKEEWMKCVNPKLYPLYDDIRAELMEVDYYKTLYQEA